MRYLGISSVFFFVLMALVPSIVLAHAPLSSADNESLSTATVISDPAKSWAVFSELHEGGEAQYYTFSIDRDERIYLSLYISPASKDKGFSPMMVIIGPGIVDEGSLPSFVEVPEGNGVLVVKGELPSQASYEAFSPTSFYELAQVDLKAPESGTFYVVVYEMNQGGNYGLAVGYVESFTLAEWILTPLNLLSIYLWTGQSAAFVFAPLAIVVVVGLGLIVRYRKNKVASLASSNLLASLAGLLFVGTGATVLVQIVVALTRAPLGSEVSISLIFAAIPAILGAGTIRLALRTGGNPVRNGFYIFCVGLLAFFVWSGYLIGPIFAILSSVLRFLRRIQPKMPR